MLCFSALSFFTILDSSPIQVKVISLWSRTSTLLSPELPFTKTPNSSTKVVMLHGLLNGVTLTGLLPYHSSHGPVAIIWLFFQCLPSPPLVLEDGCSNSTLRGTQRCYLTLSRLSSRKLNILVELLSSSLTSKILKRLMLMPLETNWCGSVMCSIKTWYSVTCNQVNCSFSIEMVSGTRKPSIIPSSTESKTIQRQIFKPFNQNC